MKSPYLFEDIEALKGFRFPKAYLEIMNGRHLPQLDPWWFLNEEPEKAKLLFRIINVDRQSSRLLVPFAKIDDETGDVACFDGEDISGDPKVFFSTGTGSLKEVDWEKRYHLANFEAWLLAARRMQH